MLKSTAGKSYAGSASLVFNYFYVVHSYAFAHKAGAESLADCFFGGKPCSIALGFYIRVICRLTLLYLIFGKALVNKWRVTVIYFL